MSLGAFQLFGNETHDWHKELCINNRILCVPSIASDAKEGDAEEFGFCALARLDLHAALPRYARCASTNAQDGVSLILVYILHVGTKSSFTSVSMHIIIIDRTDSLNGNSRALMTHDIGTLVIRELAKQEDLIKVKCFN